MLTLASGSRIYLALAPVDIRKGFDGLAAQVQQALRRDPFAGHAFLFRSRRGDRLKSLWWDGSGLCLFAKAAGTWPVRLAFGQGGRDHPHERPARHVDRGARLASRHHL
jgi:IS66 Orf2 like protein